MKQTVTILDVAKACNVSKSTVSLVINNSQSVKPETRNKVLAAINQLGYVPNLAARELQTRRKNMLGIVFLADRHRGLPNAFDTVTETLFYDTFNGISAYLHDTEYGLLSERFSAMDEDETELPALIRNNRVDGVILIGGLYRADFIKQLKLRRLPAVLVGSHVRGMDGVRADVVSATYMGAMHLLSQGHRRIALINGPRQSSNAKRKLEGYSRALQELDTPLDPALIRHTEYTGMAGYRAMKELWEAGTRPDAVLAGSDGIATGAMRYLYECGVRIPDDMSIIGYEQSILSEHAVPALTTLDIHKERMGQEACRLLIKRIAEPMLRAEHLVLEPSLILRESVKPHE